jgi:DNA-directed RNA polymerase subunit RPC12/RpoP
VRYFSWSSNDGVLHAGFFRDTNRTATKALEWKTFPTAYLANQYDRLNWQFDEMARKGGYVRRQTIRNEPFEYENVTIPVRGGIYEALTISVPHWFVGIFFASYPILVVSRYLVRTRHRKRHGLCLRCGYNLTMHRAARCPECGAKEHVKDASAD